MKNGKTLIFFFLFLSILLSSAISQRLPFRIYNVREGLTQSQVQSIVQDHDGYLWIGTRDGLALFNGSEFRNFSRKDGLESNYIITSFLDSHGNIWFSHRNRGLSKFNLKSNKISPVALPPDMSEVQIEDIGEDMAGNYWFATRGGGVFHLSGSRWQNITERDGLNSNRVTSISFQNKYMIWVGSDRGITIISSENDTLRVIRNLTIKDGLSSNKISSIQVASDKSIWIGTEDNGVDQFGENYKSLRTLNEKNGLSSNVIQTIYEDSKGRIWIGTRGGGAIKVPGIDSEEFLYLNEPQGLSYHDVICIFEDREGSIWIGTNGGGICQYRDKRFEFFSTSEGLPDRTIWSIIEDRRGNYWFGTEKGLTRYIPNPDDNRLHIQNFTQKDGMYNNEIGVVFEDHSGRLWIGIALEGVQVFDPKSKKYGKLIPFKNGDVLAIVEDQNNNIWFGTNGDGLYKLNPVTRKLTNYRQSDELTSNYIFSLLVCSRGYLWIATSKGGVSRFDSKVFKNFTSSDGFNATTAVCLTEDLEGNIWIGTEDYGLYKYDGEKFINYNTDAGLSGDGAYSLVCDNENNIWQGTRRGIEKFNPGTGETKVYGQYEGFHSIETNQNAVLKDSKGHLWFGTLDGVIKYNPENDHFNIEKPGIKITNVGVYYHNLDKPDIHDFSYRENHLTFNFIGLSFVAPEKIRYKYILKGLDQQWSPETPDNHARYTNLSPGKYEFRVMAKNNDGIWSEKPAVYEFEIATPIWRMWWFYLLIAAFIAATIFMEHKRRVRNIEKTNVILESRVEERTHELVAEKEKTQEAFRALLNSEEKYKTFIAYSTEAIWSIEFSDPININLASAEQISSFYLSGILTDCNDAMARLYGYNSVNDMIGLPLEKLLGKDNPRNIEYLQKFIKSGYRLVDEESYEIDQNGNLRVFLNSLVGIVEDNALKRAWGLQRDVTEKKHAEDALKESEERYRRLIELSPDAIIVHSEKGIEYINRAGIKLFGALRQKDIVGKSIYSMIPSEYQEEAREKISKIFQDKKPFRNLEQKMIRQDGVKIDVELIGAPMSFQGDIAGQIVIRDITERKQAENAVLEEKERLDVTLSSIEDAVITTDIKGLIVLSNHRACEMLELDEEAGTGYKFNTVAKINDKNGPVDLLQKVIESKKPVLLEKNVSLESRSGDIFQIEISAAPIKNPEGKYIGMVSAIRDITQRNRMEAELVKAQKLESIGVLAGGIAHDFNNFLTAILGNVSLAKLYTESNEKINPILIKAEKAIIQAKELTHQLLTFSKGGAPLKKTTSIVDIVQDSANFTLRGSDKFCKVSSPDDLWNVVVDAGQISQVIQNLILNAEQSMGAGKKVLIDIENKTVEDDEYPGLQCGKYVKISIIDEGNGIPEKDLSNIFDPYFTTKIKGSGLGLTTTYSIIKRHEGHINVISKVGKGTTVELFLPATERKAAREKEKQPLVQNGRGHILVMDDDKMVLELLTHILTHLGYEVDEAENGETTIEKYKSAKNNGDPIDLIIMDLTIPGGMGGKETIKELNKIDPGVKAIVSSGYSNDPIMADYNKYGFVGVLNKPYNVETLSTILQEFFNNNSHA